MLSGARSRGKEIVGRKALLAGPRRRRENTSAMIDVRAAGRSRMRPLLRLVMALAAGIALLSMGDPETRGAIRLASAQQGAVSVRVAPVTRGESASRLLLQIQVGPQDALAKNSFIRIRGLPSTVALSEGHAIAPGAWAIPLAALPSLSLILPVGVEGPSEVAIS